MRSKRFRRTIQSVVLAALAGTSCADSTGPSDVRVIALSDALIVQNAGEEPIYTMAFAEDLLPLIDWVPAVCDGCGKVAPGASRRLEPDDIVGADPEDWVLVFHWRADIGPGHEPRPGPISHVRVKLGDLAIH